MDQPLVCLRQSITDLQCSLVEWDELIKGTLDRMTRVEGAVRSGVWYGFVTFNIQMRVKKSAIQTHPERFQR